MKKYSLPFPRSYWVVPGRFLAGYYPGSRDPAKARKKLKSLLEHGIRHIINFMEKGEKNFSGEVFRPYEYQLQLLANERDIRVEVVHLQIPDMHIPATEGMIAILDEIDRVLDQNGILYVHCWGGRGRTGTVVGCYLARHGLAVGQAALDLLAELRKDDPISHLPSPETKSQADFVRSWIKGR